MNVAIYARVSTKDKGQEAENQISQMRSAANAKGEIVEVYTDHVSGSGKAKRPAFEKMMADAKARRFGMLMFWSLDRLSREGVLVTLQHLERLDQAGVCWRSHTEPYLDSCGMFKDAVLAILAVVAKQERLRISERVKAGLENARTKGRIGGRPKKPVDPHVLNRVRALRGAGQSITQIAEELGVSRSTTHRLARRLST